MTAKPKKGDRLHKIGSQEWWDGNAHYAARGIADAILVLLEREEITRGKARELLQAMAWRKPDALVPVAPWDRVAWGGDEGEEE